MGILEDKNIIQNPNPYVLLVILSIFMLFTYTVADWLFESQSVVIDFVNMITTALLSLLLVIVYIHLGKIQSDQAEEMAVQSDLQVKLANMQQDQSELMEKQIQIANAPHVLVEGSAVRDISLQVELSNPGNGIANNLRVKPYVITDLEPFTIKSRESALRRSPTADTSGMGNYLEPTTDRVPFYRNVSIGMEYKKWETWGWRNVAENLLDYGYSEFKIGFELHYDSVTDGLNVNKGPIDIGPFRILIFRIDGTLHTRWA
ncbi:hypothetical protein [Halostagnicola larsenii]|uniref:hypothetical protein n=1 Tax=Halostagnicola larsenii TaxID=353800 RepID=UPI0012F7ECDC|nr:hypothetical protein [Halostagnicola larsenii]